MCTINLFLQSTDRFFRVATELVVEACLKSSRAPTANADDKSKASNTPQLSYAVVDAYVKLLLVLVSAACSGAVENVFSEGFTLRPKEL